MPLIDQRILDSSTHCPVHKDTALSNGAYGNYCMSCWNELEAERHPTPILIAPKENIFLDKQEMQFAVEVGTLRSKDSIQKGLTDRNKQLKKPRMTSLEVNIMGAKGEVALQKYFGIWDPAILEVGRYNEADIHFAGKDHEVKTSDWFDGHLYVRHLEKTKRKAKDTLLWRCWDSLLFEVIIRGWLDAPTFIRKCTPIDFGGNGFKVPAVHQSETYNPQKFWTEIYAKWGENENSKKTH